MDAVQNSAQPKKVLRRKAPFIQEANDTRKFDGASEAVGTQSGDREKQYKEIKSQIFGEGTLVSEIPEPPFIPNQRRGDARGAQSNANGIDPDYFRQHNPPKYSHPFSYMYNYANSSIHNTYQHDMNLPNFLELRNPNSFIEFSNSILSSLPKTVPPPPPLPGHPPCVLDHQSDSLPITSPPMNQTPSHANPDATAQSRLNNGVNDTHLSPIAHSSEKPNTQRFPPNNNPRSPLQNAPLQHQQKADHSDEHHPNTTNRTSKSISNSGLIRKNQECTEEGQKNYLLPNPVIPEGVGMKMRKSFNYANGSPHFLASGQPHTYKSGSTQPHWKRNKAPQSHAPLQHSVEASTPPLQHRSSPANQMTPHNPKAQLGLTSHDGRSRAETTSHKSIVNYNGHGKEQFGDNAVLDVLSPRIPAPMAGNPPPPVHSLGYTSPPSMITPSSAMLTSPALAASSAIAGSPILLSSPGAIPASALLTSPMGAPSPILSPPLLTPSPMLSASPNVMAGAPPLPLILPPGPYGPTSPTHPHPIDTSNQHLPLGVTSPHTLPPPPSPLPLGVPHPPHPVGASPPQHSLGPNPAPHPLGLPPHSPLLGVVPPLYSLGAIPGLHTNPSFHPLAHQQNAIHPSLNVYNNPHGIDMNNLKHFIEQLQMQMTKDNNNVVPSPPPTPSHESHAQSNIQPNSATSPTGNTQNTNANNHLLQYLQEYINSYLQQLMYANSHHNQVILNTLYHHIYQNYLNSIYNDFASQSALGNGNGMGNVAGDGGYNGVVPPPPAPNVWNPMEGFGPGLLYGNGMYPPPPSGTPSTPMNSAVAYPLGLAMGLGVQPPPPGAPQASPPAHSTSPPIMGQQGGALGGAFGGGFSLTSSNGSGADHVGAHSGVASGLMNSNTNSNSNSNSISPSTSNSNLFSATYASGSLESLQRKPKRSSKGIQGKKHDGSCIKN